MRHGYRDLGLADAVNATPAGGYETDAILTLAPRGFRAVRPLGNDKAVRALPDGLPLQEGGTRADG